MDKFVFIKEASTNDGTPTSKVMMVVENCETWGEVLKEFQYFLNGCGFFISQPDVDISELALEAHREFTDKKYGYHED